MDEILTFFSAAENNIFAFLRSITFSLGGITVSFFHIMFGALVVSIIISVFWKGGRG